MAWAGKGYFLPKRSRMDPWVQVDRFTALASFEVQREYTPAATAIAPQKKIESCGPDRFCKARRDEVTRERIREKHIKYMMRFSRACFFRRVCRMV